MSHPPTAVESLRITPQFPIPNPASRRSQHPTPFHDTPAVVDVESPKPKSCIPSPDYFRIKGHADPLGRRSTLFGQTEQQGHAAIRESVNGGYKLVSPSIGAESEPAIENLYDADLRNIKLKPFLDAYDAETDWRKQSAIFKALLKPASVEMGIEAVIALINRDFPTRASELPSLSRAKPPEDPDAVGKLRRQLWNEGCQPAWQDDEHNNGLRFSFAFWDEAVGYEPPLETLDSYLGAAQEKYVFLFKRVLSDSAAIWSPRKNKTQKKYGATRTLHFENGEWVPECTRGCNLSFRDHVCIHGVAFATRCTETCEKCRVPYKPARGTAHDFSTTSQPQRQRGSCFSSRNLSPDGKPVKTCCIRATTVTYRWWERRLKLAHWSDEATRGRDQSTAHLKRSWLPSSLLPGADGDTGYDFHSTNQFAGVDDLDRANDLGSDFSSDVSLDTMLRDTDLDSKLERDPDVRADFGNPNPHNETDLRNGQDSAEELDLGPTIQTLDRSDFGCPVQGRKFVRDVPEWANDTGFVRRVIDEMYPHPHQQKKRGAFHWLIDGFFRRMMATSQLCETLDLSPKGLATKITRFKQRCEKLYAESATGASTRA